MAKVSYSKLIQELFETLPSLPFEKGNKGFLLKGDISGVQDFIFDAQTSAAAKTLKAKSFYIQVLTELSLKYILNKWNLSDKNVIFSGGAVFYLWTPEQKDLKAIQQKITGILLKKNYFPFLNLGMVSLEGKTIGTAWEELNDQVRRNGLQPFSAAAAFESFPRIPNINDPWKEFTEEFAKEYTDIENTKDFPESELFNVFNFGSSSDEDRVYSLQDAEILIENTVLNKLPLWTGELLGKEIYASLIAELTAKSEETPDNKDGYVAPKKGNIIDFLALSLFAKRRTGTQKLAVLKLDIDNLGSYFAEQKKPEVTQKLSKAFHWFFQTRLYELLDEKLENSEDEKYRENLYIIFSGGDDGFLVGAWDAVFNFAQRLHKEFEKFQKALRKEVDMGTLGEKPITLSAGLILIDEHFPVLRFGEVAEDALYKAKSRKGKNSITVFGEPISWEDFDKVIIFKDHLVKLLQHGENRSILHQFRRSARGYDNLQQKAQKGKIHPSEVWRFQYFLGRKTGLSKEGRKYMEDHFLQTYQTCLLDAITRENITSISIFPIAARWAEFETRNLTKTKKNNEQKTPESE